MTSLSDEDGDHDDDGDDVGAPTTRQELGLNELDAGELFLEALRDAPLAFVGRNEHLVPSGVGKTLEASQPSRIVSRYGCAPGAISSMAAECGPKRRPGAWSPKCQQR